MVKVADIGSVPACLDDRRFMLVLSRHLDTLGRVDAARRAFEEAGQAQDADDVVCLCGFPAHIPPAFPSFALPIPRSSRRVQVAAAWLAGLTAWLGGHVLLTVLGIG